MAGAAGGFLTRSFESMLKDPSSKKHGALQKAIQAYLDCTKDASQQAPSKKKSETSTFSSTEGIAAGNEVIEEGSHPDDQQTGTTSKEGEVSILESAEISTSVTTALASAGHTMEGAQCELVLQPLQLAFETKNTKLVEYALDCLHKLIAYDHLEGDPGLEAGKNSLLFTDILNMVCGCVDNSSSDSTVLQVLKVLLTAVASTKFKVHREPLLGIIRVCYNISLNSKSPINQATSKAMLTQIISIIFQRMESDQTVSSSSLSSINPSNVISISNNEGERTMDEQDGKKIPLGDALPINQGKEESHASIEELQNLVGGADIKGLEAILDKVVNLEDGKQISRGIDLESMNVAEHDALLLFRTLCKMGMEENDDVTTKKRHLSLELLQGLLEGVSHSFTQNFHFVDSVKAYLSYTLLRACVSSSSAVFQYAAGIFAVLLSRFRESLKGEIGFFFPLIVLRPLDSSGSPLSQRTPVLWILEKVCKDSQMLADIFVNYDCDLEAPNLFEQMVNALSRISQGVVHADPSSVVASQIASVKGSSLQCLVSVLKSLVDWAKLRQESAELNCSNLSAEDEVVVKDSTATTEESKKREDDPDQFEKANAHKFKMESAISEFNCNPAKGIELLLTNNLVEKSAVSVAKFLKDTPTLDKVMIGEYLGQHDEFPLAVMHAYVDSMKFSGLKFDMAIREFLRGFQLPGEAQKIDRILEKFAERYCADNPGLFKNADTAYVLVYAVIMLNTDAHNPMVWPKISKFDFMHMNSVSHGESGAPRELLEEIYDSIIKEEIKMKNDVPNFSKSNRQRPDAEERGNLVSILNLALPQMKSAIDSKAESEQIIKKTQALLRKQGVKRHIFHTAQQIELGRPMLEVVGWPLLAAFSVIMEEGADKEVVVLCMEGFKSGIHITHKLGMDTLRYAFLTSLIRFNLLHAPKEMRSKNVEALRTLLAICDTETESLQDTWNAVLECVSRLDYITSSPSISATVMLGSNQITRELVVQSLRELSGKAVEQVFVNSVKLSSDLIVEFFSALCAVSTEELKQTPARVFSLQKIVEISYYNMARIHLVWARIWSVLSHHFISAGSHHDQKISMYAIDSLRQLSMKYLERAELTNFTFQNDILNPFVILMQNSRSKAVRGMIVDCIVQMIKSRVGSIRSGWKSVFLIFTAASDDDLEPIIDSAFENVEQVILEHFEQVVSDCFMDCVNCLIGFASNKTSSRISLKAIALLRICEDRLAEGLIPSGALKPVDIDPKFDVTEQYWFPMLAGLSDLCLDSRGEVRNCALEVLFDLLNERGLKFSSVFWENIFHRVLFPIFDHIRHAESDSFVSSGNEWFRDTTVHSLQLVCDLLSTFYKEVSFMLPPLLSLLLDYANKPDQSVVSLSLGALVHLIKVGGHQFSESDWDTLLKSIRDASYTTQPLELLSSLGYVNLKGQPAVVSDAYANRSDSPSKDSHLDHKDNDGEISEREICPVTNDNLEMNPQLILEENGGRTIKVVEPKSPQRGQTFGQRLMDNILLRSFTSKPKARSEDVSAPSSPLKITDVIEPSDKDEDEEDPLLVTIRGKCITQLLLLGVLDSIQGKYWGRLSVPQKIAIMEVLLSLLEFASSFNSYSNLRMQIHQMPSDRPPLNLLRQEFRGTSIYMDILQKTTAELDINESKHTDSAEAIIDVSRTNNETTNMELKLKLVAEEKLVSFCEQILKEASELHSSMGEATNIDVHQVLELRAPIIVKVLKGMCHMNKQIFKKHLSKFYPIIIKLICCDQKDIRGALADLFSTQLTPLLQ